MLGRAHYRHGMRVPLEEHVLVMAPPRTGKTGWLARIIMHYPGPVLSTTTKPDVYGLTSGIRARSGRPVEVFNPASIGGVPSTFRWSPIDGCTDRAVAIRRADGFANAVNVGKDSELFKNAARAYLRALFHAAALVGGDMRLVSLWALTSSRGRRAARRGNPAGRTAPRTGQRSFPSCATRPTKPRRPTRSSSARCWAS